MQNSPAFLIALVYTTFPLIASECLVETPKTAQLVIPAQLKQNEKSTVPKQVQQVTNGAQATCVVEVTTTVETTTITELIQVTDKAAAADEPRVVSVVQQPVGPVRKLSRRQQMAETRKQKQLELMEARKQKWLAQLKAEYSIALDAYTPVLASLTFVTKAAPAEYPFYVDKLKIAVIKGVESGAFNVYLPSGWWNAIANTCAVVGAVAEVASAACGHRQTAREAINSYETRQSVNTMNQRQAKLDSQPLKNFLEVILPATVNRLVSARKGLEDTALGGEVANFIDQLNEIKRLLS